ncbi:MAG: polyketide cyclase [Microbacterium sp.]|uniref:SRPBCC family protein n=1 Tax=Microbacterium sp. TaxID=51671 RepID=UPI000DB0A2A6|nr:SRPBCC family protein [Microbacterium sp.]PZU38024.1 MAG: polyketide cyclase [Microbacterium sp.]
MRSHHVSQVIAAPPDAVYEYASNLDNLPKWAAGLARAEITRDGDVLLVESPMGRVEVRFVEQNRFGVLDHDVTLPSGTVVTNPVRVLSHPEGAEVVFTVRQIELDDDEFTRDIEMVAADLQRLGSQVTEVHARTEQLEVARDARELRDAKAADDGNRVSLAELRAELDGSNGS